MKQAFLEGFEVVRESLMEQVSFHKRIQAGERPCLEATQVEEVSK
jgi:hypothetical protein